MAAAALPAVAAPQSPQNFSPGSFSAPHEAHTGFNGPPHCAQNFRPARLSVPHFEQRMLPRAGTERSQREASAGRVGGRTHEIQRLIGRSLRTVVDLSRLGERTVTLDCDVIQADGGTRTASITGAYVALARALNKFGMAHLLLGRVAAVSVGSVGGQLLLDLNYGEDSTAEVDMNIVMTDNDRFVEVQGTGEQKAFDRDQMNRMVDLAAAGIRQLFDLQQVAIEAPPGE